MTCPNEDTDCDIHKQLEQKRKQDLKDRPKPLKYFKGHRSLNWKLQYDESKENKC